MSRRPPPVPSSSSSGMRNLDGRMMGRMDGKDDHPRILYKQITDVLGRAPIVRSRMWILFFPGNIFQMEAQKQARPDDPISQFPTSVATHYPQNQDLHWICIFNPCSMYLVLCVRQCSVTVWLFFSFLKNFWFRF